MSDTWRLLHTPPARGAWNMAVDEAILLAVGRGDVPPTLRLFAWNPPCLSLGYAQPFSDVDTGRLRANGWDVVRRPTGGRAILHTDELTYSVIGPQNEPLLAGGVLESYQRLSKALLAALHSLGIPAESSPQPGQPANSGGNKDPVCFETPSNYEITVGGKKLVGSAQARRKEGILQHGTFPLHGDLARITQALRFPDEAARASAAQRLLARAASAETILGRPTGWQEAAQAFAAAFQTALGLSLTRGDLIRAELFDAERLIREKYAHTSWTERV